jgi:hypothetical protein
MANNLIQVKRTSVSGRVPNISTLSNPGELALNMTDGILYSGNGSVVFEIGANTTNSRVTGNLTVKSIVANGSIGSTSQFLTSNSTGGLYWSTTLGYTGSQGISGYTGSAGYIGQDGYTGSIGYTGSAGTPYNFNIASNLFTGNGSNTQFTLYNGGNTTQNSVIVSINGVVQSPGSNFNITGSNTIVVFSSPPGNGSSIQIQNLSGGLIGQTGYQGSAGAPGGPTGYTGSVGVGYTGSLGNIGYTGSQGIGYTGSVGTTLSTTNKTASYIAATSDNGGLISITTGGVTVPSGTFSAGQNFTIFNNSASNQTITASGVTLFLGGTALTGNRTLAQRGICTVVCVASNVFVITGAGLS